MALVITIIILLILAAVAISMIGGDNELFAKANDAATKYNQAAKNEADLLNSLLSGKYTGSVDGGSISQDDLIQIIGELTSRIEKLENDYGNQLDLYPVGAIYISTNETNPGKLFGGTWETYGAGRTLVGVGIGEDTRGEELAFTINQTGGEYKHALSVAEMPSHNHTLTAIRGTSSSKVVYKVAEGLGASYSDFLKSASSSSGTTSSVGSSFAHNNLQPYIACYMWQRVN